jgi:hypothetical protein
MDTNGLIAKQQLEIENLKERVSEMNSVLCDIRLSLVCIGGPLNDNILGYNAAQRRPLHKIKEMIENVMEYENDRHE